MTKTGVKAVGPVSKCNIHWCRLPRR